MQLLNIYFQNLLETETEPQQVARNHYNTDAGNFHTAAQDLAFFNTAAFF